jgi:methionyl-tRNA formyltransferase
VTYAPKLTKADGKLDWTRPAAELDRQVRGLVPWPGTYTELAGETLKVLEVRPEPGTGTPGTALDDRMLIACGDGALRLIRVQRPGRGPMDAAALLRGLAVPAGTRIG